MVSSRRKMLAARDDLADKVNAIAEKKGLTLFSMVNNLLEIAIKVDKENITLDEVLDSYETVKAIREVGFALVLESLLYGTVDTAYGRSKEKTLTSWFEAGDWIGKQFKTKQVTDPILEAAEYLKRLSWNVPEFSFKTTGKNINIRIISPRFTESYTECFSRFLEGMLESFNFDLTYKELGKGNIRLEATQRSH